MTDRYVVRRTENGYGVWDAAVNGWHGSQFDQDEVNALRRAASLNVRIAERGGRRTVDPPKQVIIAFHGGQVRGFIDAWVRDSGQWWGHVTVGTRDGWYPAFALRQA